MSRLRIGQVVVWVLSTFLVWQSAWLSDDSLITIRAALNWDAGYGPVFNIDEAVQAYTHPLWFFLITAVGGLTGSWIYGALYLNIACAATGWFLLVLRTRNWWQLVTVSVFMVLGNTVLDWSTSGLEGGLSILLFAVLTSQAVLARPALAGFVMGLLLLCRLDFALLLAPWATLWWVSSLSGRRQRIGVIVAAVVPVASWAAWAKLTYGFVLPATFSAKTNSEIPLVELASRGLEYATRSLVYDPLLVVAFLVMLPILIIAGDRLTRAWVVGVAVYCAYVVLVGGDYMLGRFFLVPLFVCLLELTRTHLPAAPAPAAWLDTGLLWGITVAVVLLGLLQTRAFDWRVTEDQGNPDYPYFADERIGWTHWGRSLNPFGLVERRPPYYPTDLPFLDEQATRWPRGSQVTPEPVVVCHGLGGMGLLVGPQVHIIDPCGLSDRFLASIPFTPTGPWKAGHFERPLPDGYFEAVRDGDPTRVKDPHMAQQLTVLWEKIRR